MNIERRRSPRQHHSGLLLIEAPTLAKGFWWPSTLVDISDGGLALQLPPERPELSPGIPVYLSLTIVDRICFDRIPAIIVRQQGDVCAVEFGRWKNEDRKRLGSILRDLERQQDPQLADDSGSDRRRHRRNPVHGVRGSFPLLYDVEVLNMSATGLAVKCPRPLEVGSKYRLALPAYETAVELEADVRWCRLAGVERDGDALFSVFRSGLDFADSLDETRRALLALPRHGERTEGERRISERVEVDLSGPATVALPHSFSVHVLSLSGMLIETAQPVDPGWYLELELMAGDRALPVIGRVANVEPIGKDEGCRAGIAFEGLDQGSRRALEEVTESFLA